MDKEEKDILELYIKASKEQIKKLEKEECVKRYKKLKKIVNKATKYYFKLS